MKRMLRSSICTLVAVFLLAGIAFSTEKVFYYHTDPAGTPLAMTDANGAVVWRADYRPFGEEQSIDPQTTENDMKFVGKEKDKETGLYYFGARYMRPEVGRFVTVDPVGPVDPRTNKTNYAMLTNPQKLNRYAYSLNNPYRYVDPDGREVILTSHIVALGQRHSALLLRPDDQSKNWGANGFKKDQGGKWYATLSAGPEDGLLKSDLNRPTDAPNKNRIDALVRNPFGSDREADSKFIETLLSKDGNYGDNLKYFPLPSLISGTYNSNSYTSGLLNSVDAELPKPNGSFPGIDKPVPKEYFQ